MVRGERGEGSVEAGKGEHFEASVIVSTKK